MRKLILLLITALVASNVLFPLILPVQKVNAAGIERQECWDFMGGDQGQNGCLFHVDSIDMWNAAQGVHVGGGRTSDGEPIKEGAVGVTTKAIAYTVTTPPVHTATYVADVLENFGVVDQAYAQGIGFSALTPVLNIWRAFRNMAYFVFVIIFVVIGFMIMFRAQINPQTVVTIQMALPKLVVTMILITFSYAIAGFIVDLIYLIIFAATALMEQFGILSNATTANDVVFDWSIVRIGVSFLMSPREIAGSAANAVSNIITSAVSLPSWLDWLSDSLAYLIIAVAILINMFRTLFALISSWIQIIISTIFAPIQLLLHAVPGNDMFTVWLKTLAGHALVFPAVAIMLLIGAALVGGPSMHQLGIVDTPDVGYGEGEGWIPPLITTGTDGTGVNAARAIIGIGIIMLLPEVVNLIKEAFGIKGGMGELAMQNARRGTVIASKPWGAAQQTANERQQQVRDAQAYGNPPPPMSDFRPGRTFLKNLFGF
jgi:hypothetical protein